MKKETQKMSTNGLISQSIFKHIVITICLFAVLFLALPFIVSCDDEIEAKDVKIVITDGAKYLHREGPNRTYTFDYGSNRWASVILKASLVNPSESEKDFTDFVWTIHSSANDKTYTTGENGYINIENGQPIAIVSGDKSIITLNMGEMDTLSDYTVIATPKNKTGIEGKFLVAVDKKESLNSQLSISYSGISIDTDGNLSSRKGDNITSNISPNATLTLVSGMAYQIGFEDETKSPFGTLTYSIEDDTDGNYSFYDKNSKEMNKSVTSAAKDTMTYLYIDNSETTRETSDKKIKVTVSAGDKKSQVFYVQSTTKRKHDTSIDDVFSVNAFPVAGGYSVEFTLQDTSYKKDYAIAYSIDGAVDRKTIYFDDYGKAAFIYDNSDYPEGATEKEVRVKGKLVSTSNNAKINESADKECTFTIKQVPASGIITINNNNNNSADLLISPTNRIRKPINKTEYNKITGFLDYVDYIPLTLSISPIDLTANSTLGIELSDLDDAHFVIEHDDNILVDVPLKDERGNLNLETYKYDIRDALDGGEYKAYIKNVKGYTDAPLDQVSTSPISVSNIEGTVMFFQYKQDTIDKDKAYFKVKVLNTNIAKEDFNLYIEYSENGGTTWSTPLKFSGSDVYSTDKEDLAHGKEITSGGQSKAFLNKSDQVLFRSLIVAKEENEAKIQKPTTGIFNESREYITTASTMTTESCTISDETQDYYNARQITITRPYSDSTAKYYIEKNGAISTITASKCVNNITFGKVMDTKGKVYATCDENKAILLFNENDLALNKTNSIIVKTSRLTETDAYTMYPFSFYKLDITPDVNSCWPGPLRNSVAEIKIDGSKLYSGHEYIYLRQHIKDGNPASRKSYSSYYPNSITQRNSFYRYEGDNNKKVYEEYKDIIKGVTIMNDMRTWVWSDGNPQWTEGFIAKKGYLRGIINISTLSNERKSWTSYKKVDSASKTITSDLSDLIPQKGFRQ